MNQNRREFLQKAGLVAASLPLLPTINTEAKERNVIIKTPQTIAEAQPNDAQKAWMELKFGLFVHFGINTYYDKEWSDGTLDHTKVNPTKLDTDQWCRAAKAAGMKYVVLVTKHHDGFCNWRTKYTKYSIGHTPFKKDILAELINSAQKHGLKVGLYYSLWDRHEKSHDTDEWKYIDFMLKQLEELLTKYGNVIELWFDGFWKKQQSGWTKKEEIDGENVEKMEDARDEAFIQAWRNEGAFRWRMDYVYGYIKSLQPNCLVMNNSTTAYPGVPLHPVDIRSGEKATKVFEDKKVWKWLGKDVYMPIQIETTMSQKGNEQFKSGSWFWHSWDDSCATKTQILDWLSIAEKMQANLLLNVGPSPEGKLRDIDYKTLMELRQ
jgi:alpha-L-fucosidase